MGKFNEYLEAVQNEGSLDSKIISEIKKALDKGIITGTEIGNVNFSTLETLKKAVTELGELSNEALNFIVQINKNSHTENADGSLVEKFDDNIDKIKKNFKSKYKMLFYVEPQASGELEDMYVSSNFDLEKLFGKFNYKKVTLQKMLDDLKGQYDL